jgi:hypothetical protein
MQHNWSTSLMGVTVPVALADGSLWFLGFLIFTFFVVVYSFYTRVGSAINQRPYGNVYSPDTAAKKTLDEVSGRDPGARIATWSRGTR